MAAKLSARGLPFALRALSNKINATSSTSFRRTFSIYDQINVLPGVPEDQIRIEGCTDTGFVANGVQYEGSLICINNLILSWSPRRLADVTSDSLSIFQLLQPAPEILVIGSGKRSELVDPGIRNFLRTKGIKVESVDSWNAAATFNFLNEEGRVVAGAFLPLGISS